MLQKIHVFDQFYKIFEGWKFEITDYNVFQIDNLSFDKIHLILFKNFEIFFQNFNKIKSWNVLIVIIIKNECLILQYN